MTMLDNRGEYGCGSFPAIGSDGLPSAFHDAPAIFPASFNPVHHFPQLPPDVRRPQSSRYRVKAHSPRIAKTVCPDFGPCIRCTHEWIVSRNGVGPAVICAIYVDTQDRTQQIAYILPCV